MRTSREREREKDKEKVELVDDNGGERSLGKITALVGIQRQGPYRERRGIGYVGGTHAVLYVCDYNKAPPDRFMYHFRSIFVTIVRTHYIFTTNFRFVR